MKRTLGRSIYVVDLGAVVSSHAGATNFAALCADCSFSAVWARLGRGRKLDPNFSNATISSLQTALASNGVELWGWHVPFCKTQADASSEAANVVSWAKQFDLAGVIVDAERTKESPRFQGTAAEADTYMKKLGDDLSAQNRGLALSSHDQPSLHGDLPFEHFLRVVGDNCPQVYYRSVDVTTRLDKSVHDYKVLEAARNFADRYKPTGNITVKGDVRFADVPTCVSATKNFLNVVRARGYEGHSFWCMDEAPSQIWDVFKNTPVGQVGV